MQTTGPAVIAQPLPQLQHFVLGRGGQRTHVGKTRSEPAEIVEALRHAGLLQDHLRQPDQVRIGRLAPRQRTEMPYHSIRTALMSLVCFIGRIYAQTVRSTTDAFVVRIRSSGAIRICNPRTPALT